MSDVEKLIVRRRTMRLQRQQLPVLCSRRLQRLSCYYWWCSTSRTETELLNGLVNSRLSGRVTRLHGCIGDRLKRRSCSVFWYSGNLLICYCSRLVLIGPSDADGLFPPLTLISGGVILSYRGTRLPSSVFGPSNSAHSENNLLLLRCSLLPPVTLLLYDVNVNDIIHTICVRGTEELG